jgi:methionine salvage enolase-phosphatase E1
LLFRHTNHGDITNLIDGCTYFKDVTKIDFDPSVLEVENKFDGRGYESIIEQTGLREWTFFSDVPREVTAAEKAGMKGYVVVRDRDNKILDPERMQHKELFNGLENPLQFVGK